MGRYGEEKPINPVKFATNIVASFFSWITTNTNVLLCCIFPIASVVLFCLTPMFDNKVFYIVNVVCFTLTYISFMMMMYIEDAWGILGIVTIVVWICIALIGALDTSYYTRNQYPPTLIIRDTVVTINDTTIYVELLKQHIKIASRDIVYIKAPDSLLNICETKYYNSYGIQINNTNYNVCIK